MRSYILKINSSLWTKFQPLKSNKESGCNSVTWLDDSTVKSNLAKRCYLKNAYCKNAAHVSSDPSVYHQYPGLTSAFKTQSFNTGVSLIIYSPMHVTKFLAIKLH